MYLEYYGLKEFPFSLTPDTQFFFDYGTYRDAFNTLLVALRSGEGFIKVTGEVGTGKTLLCRKLLGTLDSEFHTAYIPNPLLSPSALSSALAEELNIGVARNAGQHRTLKEITARLMQLAAEDKRVVLLIDEAQAMPEETMEALRLLTNLETEKRKLLQVVLFGQPELDELLNKRSTRQLRQRITFSFQLTPIDRTGLESYVNHRLLIAGSSGGIQFTPAAFGSLYTHSRGIPRLVNVLAHKSLMAGFGLGTKLIDKQQVALAAADTEDVHQVDRRRRRALLYWLTGIAVVALAAIAAWLLWPPGGSNA